MVQVPAEPGRVWVEELTGPEPDSDDEDAGPVKARRKKRGSGDVPVKSRGGKGGAGLPQSKGKHVPEGQEAAAPSSATGLEGANSLLVSSSSSPSPAPSSTPGFLGGKEKKAEEGVWVGLDADPAASARIVDDDVVHFGALPLADLGGFDTGGRPGEGDELASSGAGGDSTPRTGGKTAFNGPRILTDGVGLGLVGTGKSAVAGWEAPKVNDRVSPMSMGWSATWGADPAAFTIPQPSPQPPRSSEPLAPQSGDAASSGGAPDYPAISVNWFTAPIRVSSQPTPLLMQSSASTW